MNSITVTQKESSLKKTDIFFQRYMEKTILFFSIIFAVIATIISYQHKWILAYGDAESHINISKNIVSGLTPGLAQLGGVWLPLTHLMMAPFVIYNPLWRTGLAGSLVSGIFYVITCVYIFKLTRLISKSLIGSFLAFIVFAINPNILYLQTTPMTEIPLISFFVLSTYYFVKYLYKTQTLPSLILAGLFAFCASLTRYDGWFLIAFQTLFIFFSGINKKTFTRKKSDTILFITLAALGIIGWFVWCWLIFGNPLYFDDSIYSAKSQQIAWFQRGELPGYHNIMVSLVYYAYTTLENSGVIIYILSFLGAIVFMIRKCNKEALATITILFVPFIFNVLSLFLGQSVIFIPGLTPENYLYHLFNVRYGVTMIPFMAVFFGYLISRVHFSVKTVLIALLFFQTYLFINGTAPVITLTDGTHGLSAEKVPENVEAFINKNYDGGSVLLDSYARTISITQSTIPMQDIIYVGNKPYWGISLKQPQRYAQWIIMQKNDAVWTAIYANPSVRGELYKYFKKVYTSNQILIFERNS